jgi:hypothetical protein
MIDTDQSDETEDIDDPFAVFTEWASEADEAAYSSLAEDDHKSH